MSQLFASGGQSIGVSASTSVLPMNSQDWSPLGSPCSPRDSQESSPTPQFKRINSSALSFLHINMVKYVFYYVTFTTLKKKKKLTEGHGGFFEGVMPCELDLKNEREWAGWTEEGAVCARSLVQGGAGLEKEVPSTAALSSLGTPSLKRSVMSSHPSHCHVSF